MIQMWKTFDFRFKEIWRTPKSLLYEHNYLRKRIKEICNGIILQNVNNYDNDS